MHQSPQPEPRPPNGSENRRSSVVPLNPVEVPGRLDDVPTIIGQNPDALKPPAAAFGLAPGSRLSHFEIVGPIGAGGMASVFKAHDLSLSREVALKILPPDFARDPDAVTRFKQEARAAAQLNHENIARVFFTGEEHGLHFIAFEFVEGETLREVIDRLGTVPPGECVRYMLDVAAGLHHASERGVIHRDVKPSNILITPAGRAKLIDMGLARSRELTPVNGGVTQSGTTLGTFDYISPEQAIDPRTADVRSDIYSLGCTCYHALTGRPPVPDGNAARKLAAHQGEAPVDPRLINRAVTDELAEVLDRMMAKNPVHRYQTAAELIDALARVGRTLGVTTDGVELPSALAANAEPPRPPTNTRAATVALAAGGFAVAMAVVVAVGVWSRSSNPLPPPWAYTPRTTATTETASGELPEARPIAKSFAVANTEEMREAIKAGVPKLILSTGVEYDLTTADGMVLSGKAIEWVCPADPKAATVRVMAGTPADRGDEPRPGTLTFTRCESVRLSGIRFEILQPFDEPANEPIGVMFSDIGRVELAEAVFETGGATVTTNGCGLTLMRCGSLTAKHCYFGLKNWTAVELAGTPTAALTECGFVTSRAGLEVTSGMALPDRTAIALKHTTFLLQSGASAVTVNREAKCDLTAGFSLFAAPAADASRMMTTDLDRKATIVRGDQGEATFTTADDQPNAAYLVTPPSAASGPLPDQLKSSPWANARADADKPWAALELNTKLKGLRTATAGVGILGVRTLPTERHRLYDWPLPALFASGVKVWHPNATPSEREDRLPNVYFELAEAVLALKGKDELHIRGSGRIEVPTAVVLNVPNRTVVVRAEKGSSPVLVPTDQGRRDAAVFRLEAGELTLDGLGFLLQPSDTEGTTAVVSVSGGRRCDLRNCVVTLDEDADERAAVVSVADVSEQMKGDTAVRPGIGFENCLVRGRGRLLRASSSIPMDVTASNVGVAVSGPLFEFGIPTRPPHSGSGVSVHLTQLTAVLGGPLLDLRGTRRASDDKSMVVPVDVRADGCLFAPLETGTHPLIHLSGVDPTGTDRCLNWMTGPLGNAYTGWDVFAEIPARDGAAEPQRWDATEWRRWSGEREAAIGRATLTRSPTMKGLSAVRSSDLELTVNPFDDRIGSKTTLLPVGE